MKSQIDIAFEIGIIFNEPFWNTEKLKSLARVSYRFDVYFFNPKVSFRDLEIALDKENRPTYMYIYTYFAKDCQLMSYTYL